MTPDLEIVDERLRSNELPRATALLRKMFYAQPSLANARAVNERLGRAGLVEKTQSCRVWWLRSFTVEPMFPLLRAGALLEGLDLQQRAGDYNAYAQEILNPQSAMYVYDPNVVVLAVQTRDILPQLWESVGGVEHLNLVALVDRTLEDIRNWIGIVRSRSSASVILCDFAQPIRPALGVLDGQAVESQQHLIEGLNQGLRKFAASTQGVYVLGFDALIARVGRERFFDERKWLTARMPIAAQFLWPVARECLAVLMPLTGRVRKAVVVDLDNTLWGGIVGEDGPDGLHLGGEYPGAAFLALQRVLLDFHRRGIILAIASKNNHADAMVVLVKHPSMLLRPHHFAAMQITWNAKSDSLKRIAGELNIGLDSLVFVDDNPAEREEIRQNAPDVLVVELPADPMDYAATLRELPMLERLRVVAEDRDRGRQYAEQRARAELEQSAGTLEEFYRSLGMKIVIEPVTSASLARVSQLTQKTNQFNLTTRRYDEARIAALMGNGQWRIFACSVRDRFGDNGLVGVAILRNEGSIWEIDTLLLSCRVIGRTVETAMLSHLISESRASGGTTLQGWFSPTAKNKPAADFYRSHGFQLLESNDQGTLWSLDIAAASVEWPSWLERAAGGVAGESI